MKGRSDNKPSPSLPLEQNPRAERRRKLRLERRHQQLIQVWRVFIFSSLSYGLGILVINNGWSSIGVAQIYVIGSSKIQARSIVNASGMSFPQPLFSINPKKLETNLLKELPVKSVQIRRRLIPASLEIELKERKPIAYADRRGPSGKEKGMLDKHGNWMPLKMASKLSPPVKDIYVEGWMASHQSWISIILDNQENLGSPLEKIIVRPNGELSIKTQDFEVIHLGTNSFYITEQIKALHQLSKNLPSNFIEKAGTILDIRDPSKPELQISQD